MSTLVDGLDLADIEIIDTHVHPMRRTTTGADHLKSADMYAGLRFPTSDSSVDEQRARLSRATFDELLTRYPRQLGLNHYMARVHGVPATLEGIDSAVSQRIDSDDEVAASVSAVMTRENVSAVVLQAGGPDGTRSGSPEITAPVNFYPPGRFVWTWPFESLLDTARSSSLGATTLPDVLALIETSMETAANNGCRGFKNGSAYRRSYELAQVTPEEADAALRDLLASAPGAADERTVAARGVYEDYLFKHIYLTAGKLDVPIVMHMAVAQHPLLRAEFNDASALFDVFHDEDVLRAGTRFVIRNTGYPAHHIVSSIISQFPNVYTDTAYFSQYPGVLEETYRVLLAVGPSDKIMHGSDVVGVPEGIGYCAWNTRHVLAQILRDYRSHYGWSMTEIERMAGNILHANARKVYGISSS